MSEPRTHAVGCVYADLSVGACDCWWPTPIEREAATPEPSDPYHDLALGTRAEQEATPEPSDLRDAVEALPMFQEDYVIHAMNGKDRTPVTPADWVEAYRAAVLAIIEAHHCTIDEAALAEALHEYVPSYFGPHEADAPTDGQPRPCEYIASLIAVRLRGEP